MNNRLRLPTRSTLLLCSLISSSSFYTAQIASAEDAKPATAVLAPDTVAATVNGKKITIADIDKQIEQKPNFAYVLENAKDNPKMLSDLRRRVVHAMINRQILLEEATKSAVVPASEIDDSVKKVVDGYGGKEKLEELLKAIKTDYNTFDTEIRKDFLINGYIDKVLLKDVTVSEQDIKKEFDKDPKRFVQKESVHASHILIKVDPQAPKAEQDAALAKITKIYDDITKNKKDFAAEAKAESQCPSASQGGDLGSFNKGMMVPEFEKVAFSLKPGEVSKPFKTQFGYHIVTVQEHTPEGAGSLESAKPQIEQQLLAKKRELVVEQKLADLRKGYAVTTSI